MPLTIASVLGFIPTNIWRPLKKFITKDGIIVFDIPFKLSTKYTPGLLIIMMCLSFANQFARNVEMDCQTSSGGGGGGGGQRSGSGGYGGSTAGGADSELNDFCWNFETFLVAKALQPAMRGVVTFPGVSGYKKDVDELIKQRYYKHVWLILGKLAVFAFLPLFLWKFRGTQKIKSLTEVTGTEETTVDDERVSYYLETVGFNDSFAYHYLICKIFAALTPLGQWYYVCGFIGKLYRFYGVDVVINFMDNSDPWPNPMDALFPKMAKCEMARYGYGGDMEVKSAQCLLPMNNLTQWSFFIYWWWLALVIVINFGSCIRLAFILLPPFRRCQYRKFVANACRDEVEKARTYTIYSKGQTITKKQSKRAIIDVNLSFGDWLVLNFIKKNLQDWQFRDFVRRMVLTQNYVLQLKPVPPIPIYDAEAAIVDEKGGPWDHPSAPGANKVSNMEIGFISAVLDGHTVHPPTYSACETVSDCDTNNEMSMSPSPVDMRPNGGRLNSSVLSQENAINITPPVKIDRSALMSKNSANKSKDSGKSDKKGAAPKPVRNFQRATPIPNKALSPPKKPNTQYDEEEW